MCGGHSWVNRHRIIPLHFARNVQIRTQTAAAVVAMTAKVGGATTVAVPQGIKRTTAEEEGRGESREENFFHDEMRGFVNQGKIPSTSLLCQGAIPRTGAAASRFDTPFVLA